MKAGRRGRPVTARPVKNSVGLMRRIMGEELGVNGRIGMEIEAVASRPVLAAADERGRALGRRISDFVGGAKPIPEWIDIAARKWCVSQVEKALKERNVCVTAENLPVRVSSGTMRSLMAEGIVSSALSAAAAGDGKRLEDTLRLISRLVAPRH